MPPNIAVSSLKSELHTTRNIYCLKVKVNSSHSNSYFLDPPIDLDYFTTSVGPKVDELDDDDYVDADDTASYPLLEGIITVKKKKKRHTHCYHHHHTMEHL